MASMCSGVTGRHPRRRSFTCLLLVPFSGAKVRAPRVHSVWLEAYRGNAYPAALAVVVHSLVLHYDSCGCICLLIHNDNLCPPSTRSSSASEGHPLAFVVTQQQKQRQADCTDEQHALGGGLECYCC